MPTPPKPYAVLAGERKSHRTKAELEQRKEAEESLLSGVKIKETPEVRANPQGVQAGKEVVGCHRQRRRAVRCDD